FKGWIRQGIRNSQRTERRPDPPNQHVGLTGATEIDEAANHDVVAGLHETTGADVGERRGINRIQIVDLDDGDPGAVIRSGDDGGVSARIERGDNRGFSVVVRGEAGAVDVDRLFGSYHAADGARAPVVIRADEGPGAIMQFQARILKGARQESVE